MGERLCGRAGGFRTYLLLVVLGSGLLAVGCGDDSDSSSGTDAGPSAADAGGSDGAVAAASVELGTGTSAYVALSDDDPLELVAGPQGGWHVDLALRLSGLLIEDLEVSYEGTAVGGTEPLTEPLEIRLRETRVTPVGNQFLRFGDTLIFDITAPADVVGMDVVVRVRVMATDGKTASDERRVRIVDEI